MKKLVHKTVASVAVLLLALVAFTGPAAANSNWAVVTGASASDGLLLASIDMTSNSGFCEGLVYSGTNTILSGGGALVVDCNADGINAAALLNHPAGTSLAYDYVAGTYFGGGSFLSVAVRAGPFNSPPA